MAREKFDPTATYGTLPPRELKVGDRVTNGALYPATSWEVLEIVRGEAARIEVQCDKGRAWFSAPYKWTHADGTAMSITKNEEKGEK